MPPESLKLLEDVRTAVTYILDHSRGKTFDDYFTGDLLRPAIERHFEIIGEALVRLRASDPATLALIPEHRQIIAFRNVLIHGYDAIDHRRVWDAIQNSLPQLHQAAVLLLPSRP
jgi:uncharacterized protein with HEPN domain